MTQTPVIQENQAPIVGREPPRILFKLLNPLMKAIVQSPFHTLVSKRLMLITVTGRKTGKRYVVPVGYTQLGKTIYFGTKGGWYKNLVSGQALTLRLRGHDVAATIDVIRDEAGMRESYQAFLPQAPHYAQILGIRIDKQGNPYPADVVRVRQEGHIVGRIHLT